MVTIYTTATCPKCKVLKSKMDSKNILYKECMDTDKMASMNIISVPKLDTGNGELLDFKEANDWVNAQ